MISGCDTASGAPLYPDSNHEATNPKTSLHLAAQMNLQQRTLRSGEALYIKKKRFEVPMGYTGTVWNKQRRCDEFCTVIVDDRHKSSKIRLLPANRAGAEAFEKLTGYKFSRE